MSEGKKELFSPIEIDAIGEISNISLGSSATAVSNLLDRRVDITTPQVRIVRYDDLEFAEMEPAIGVEITYTGGLSGSNLMLLKQDDVRQILEILMPGATSEKDFEVDEMALSAVCEVMNQMMGASATALAEFLGTTVNISPPESFEVEDARLFKKKYFEGQDTMIVIKFRLSIENCMESEFMTLMKPALGKQMIAPFGLPTEETDEPEAESETSSGADDQANSSPDGLSNSGADRGLSNSGADDLPNAQAETAAADGQNDASSMSWDGTGSAGADVSASEAAAGAAVPQAPSGAAAGQAVPGVAAPQAPSGAAAGQAVSGVSAPQAPSGAAAGQSTYGAAVPQGPSSAYDPAASQASQMPQAPAGAAAGVTVDVRQPLPQGDPSQPKVINVQPVYDSVSGAGTALTDEESSNLDMIMSVPLQISVEIGRTRKPVREIMDFSNGTLVVLDKMAGDMVDIFVNGQQIARGDVVVIDDSFGVRITEIFKDTKYKLD